jgi:glycosyltransferase involved in cell wall biosynthesis
MSTGKPVIATDSGGTPEVVKDGANGVMFNFGDHLGLAKKITRLIAEPDAARKIGASARSTIEGGFTIQSHVRKIELIYEEMIREGA